MARNPSGYTPPTAEHPLPRREPVAKSLDARVGRKEFVVPDDLDVSGFNAEQIEHRESETES